MLTDIITDKSQAIIGYGGLVFQPDRDVLMHLSDKGWEGIDLTLRGAFKNITAIWFHPYIVGGHDNPIAIRGTSKMTGNELDYILCCPPVEVYHNLYSSALIRDNHKFADTVKRAAVSRAEALEAVTTNQLERQWLFWQCAKTVYKK